jgi:hypothetical protein
MNEIWSATNHFDFYVKAFAGLSWRCLKPVADLLLINSACVLAAGLNSNDGKCCGLIVAISLFFILFKTFFSRMGHILVSQNVIVFSP